ncbi:MAG: hypothetical protein OXC00_15290 [Acidimicrobiaceae bacterium]|nr:hypothetical protein [Acidimicrobiaceae bacterium]
MEELWAAEEDLGQIRDAYAPAPAVEAACSSRGLHFSLVAVDPGPYDSEVYGEALPIAAQWRRAMRSLEEPPHTLAWLGATDRLLRLEIQLIDDRRLNLPPADGPWDDARRDTELQLRQDRLRKLRLQSFWTEPLE